MKSFEPNYIGRDFVVGDLHGCYSSLMRAMDAMSFDRSKDRLFSVGDLINRGSQSQACLELLSEPWFQAISGNHEVMFTTFLNSGQHRQHFLNSGGSWVLNPDTANFPSWQDWYQHWSARLSALPRAATLKLKTGLAIGLVHAECNESRWSQLSETDEDLIWGRFRIRHMI